MRRELYASAAIHAALLLWMAIGDLISRDTAEIDFEVTGVTLLSTAEFEALQSPPAEPTPSVVEAQPAPAPEPRPTPPPVIEAPEAIAALDPPPLGDPTSAPSDTPVARDVPRVAPLPAPTPEPDVETAPDVVEAPTDQAVAEQPVEEVTETAPEEATTEIVTEAEEPSASLSPVASPRPTSRPERPVVAVAEPAPAPEPDPVAEPAPEPEPAADPMADAIAAAVADAVAPAPAPAPAAASGPPLTQGERDGLIADVRACWNVGSLSSEALRTVVTVSVQMARDGRPEGGSIRMISSSGGSDVAARQSFEAARRAILRCGASGFNLPGDKYDHWQTIEMTFNPEDMRLR